MTGRRPLMVAVILVLALGYGFQQYVLGPKHERADALDAQIATAGQALTKARSDLAAGQAAAAAYDRNYATVTRLGRAVPDSKDTPALVYQLDTAARRAGVDFLSVALSSAGAGDAGAAAATTDTAATGVTEIPLTLSFQGSYFALNAFLRRIGGLVRVDKRGIAVRGRLVNVEDVDLKPSSKGFPDIEAAITATAYTQPAETTAAPSATPGAAATPSTGTPAAGATAAPAAPSAGTTTTTDR